MKGTSFQIVRGRVSQAEETASAKAGVGNELKVLVGAGASADSRKAVGLRLQPTAGEGVRARLDTLRSE